MLKGPALAKAITACQAGAVPLRRLVYRAIHLSWFDPLAKASPLFTRSGVRSRLSAAPTGAPEALYAALEADTAFREFNQNYFQALQTPPGAAVPPG
ncbi:MAG: hypothetical protein ACRC7O_03115 [Fimbriiglobus sp.]